MKRVFSRITAAILVTGTLAACAPQSETSEESGTVRVLAPQSNSKSGYSLQTVDLLGIENLQTVSGKFVRFFMSPRIIKDTLHGKPAVARFIKNDHGEFIPANEITQHLVTIYAHTQKLAHLDEELGAAGVNQWPRTVGVGVRVKGGMNNNAFYDGATDSMLVVPYTSAGLPIAINAGILAHEHFHSLFYKMVLKGHDTEDSSAHGRDAFLEAAGIVQEDLTERRRGDLPVIKGDKLDEATLLKYYRLAMLRGLNEGLADYWGWMYTGNPDFIAQSLPSEKRVRSLNADDVFGALEVPSTAVIKNKLEIFFSEGSSDKFRSYVTGYAYSIGTQFSRMLKRYTEVSAKAREQDSVVSRKEVAKVILKLLPTLNVELAAKKNSFYTSEQFVLSFAQQVPDMARAECEFLTEVLNSSTDSNNYFVCNAQWKIEAQKAARGSEQ